MRRRSPLLSLLTSALLIAAGCGTTPAPTSDTHSSSPTKCHAGSDCLHAGVSGALHGNVTQLADDERERDQCSIVAAGGSKSFEARMYGQLNGETWGFIVSAQEYTGAGQYGSGNLVSVLRPDLSRSFAGDAAVEVRSDNTGSFVGLLGDSANPNAKPLRVEGSFACAAVSDR